MSALKKSALPLLTRLSDPVLLGALFEIVEVDSVDRTGGASLFLFLRPERFGIFRRRGGRRRGREGRVNGRGLGDRFGGRGRRDLRIVVIIGLRHFLRGERLSAMLRRHIDPFERGTVILSALRAVKFARIRGGLLDGRLIFLRRLSAEVIDDVPHIRFEKVKFAAAEYLFVLRSLFCASCATERTRSISSISSGSSGRSSASA